MKKYIWIILCILITTIVLIVINNMIYGTDRIWIADYMPPSPMKAPWEMVKFKRTIIDMKFAIIIGIFITTIENKILYKNQILKKELKSVIISLMIFIIPLIISGIKLSSIYGFTS